MSSSRFSISSFPQQHQYPEAEPRINRDLAAKVDSLIDKYKRVTTMHPSLEQFGKNPEYFALFTKVFNHHVRLIKSRPQELERGYVTVYESALMDLTAGGRDMSNKGAIALFVEQILGVKKAGSAEDLEVMLKGNVAMRSALLESVEACKKTREAAAVRDIGSSSPAPGTYMQTEPHSSQSHFPHGHVARLLDTFKKAEAEYRSTEDTDGGRTKETVTFLRDSAENALGYLRISQPDHYMIPKLKRTFEMAQARCVGFNGGRKRPFEMNAQDYAKRTRRSNEIVKNAPRGDHYRP